MDFNFLQTKMKKKYSHNKCSYRNDIETRKKPKNKEKIKPKFAI